MDEKNLQPPTNLTPNKVGEPYLRLQLEEHIPAVLSMKHTQNVVAVPANRISPVPNLPDCILGLLYQRSRVFWVIDLPQALDLLPIDRNLQEYYVTIAKIDNLPLGLVVPEIKGIFRIIEKQISSPTGSIASGLIPYLKGCVIQDKEVLPVLDPEAIANSPNLRTQF
jgi:twitching motility protein PilI